MSAAHWLLVILLLIDLLLTRRGMVGILQWLTICIWFGSGMIVGWPR